MSLYINVFISIRLSCQWN